MPDRMTVSTSTHIVLTEALTHQQTPIPKPCKRIKIIVCVLIILVLLAVSIFGWLNMLIYQKIKLVRSENSNQTTANPRYSLKHPMAPRPPQRQPYVTNVKEGSLTFKHPAMMNRKLNGEFHFDDDPSAREESNKQRILPKTKRSYSEQRLPQCIIIGVRKGGTRALLEFLSLHPDIAVARNESHFFDENYSKGLDWYRRKMPYSQPGQITIEKTPSYFVTEHAPERMKRMNSSMKIILLVREPLSRAISDHAQVFSNRLKRGLKYKSFEARVMDSSGRIKVKRSIIKQSLYHINMVPWLKLFPLRQFHFVNAERMVYSPMEELQKIESFLQIPHKFKDDDIYFNRTKNFYCIRPAKDRQNRCLGPNKGRHHAKVNRQVVTKFHAFFRPHNDEFYKMIGQNFHWP